MAKKEKKKKKPKTKSGLGFKGLVLGHGEKFVVGLVMLVVAWLLYSALGRESLEAKYQPAGINASADSATKKISQANYQTFTGEKPDVKPIDGNRTIIKPVDPLAYVAEKRLNPPPFDRKHKRGDPELLPVAALEVTAGVGPFAIRDPLAMQSGLGGEIGRMPERQAQPQETRRNQKRNNRGRRGGEDAFAMEDPGGQLGLGMAGDENLQLPEGYRPRGVSVDASSKLEQKTWAVVLGKVPFKEQWAKFDEAFKESVLWEPQYDIPSYYGYRVQRIEVDAYGQPIKGGEFIDTLNYAEIKGSMQSAEAGGRPVRQKKFRTMDWGGNMPQPLMLADPLYLDGVLTYPLGPLVGRDWDTLVIHSDTPLDPGPEARPGMMSGEIPADEPVENADERDTGSADDLGFHIDPRGPRGGQPGMVGGASPFGRGEGVGMMRGGGGYAPERGGIMPPGGMSGAMMSQPGIMGGYSEFGQGAYGQAGMQQEIPDHKLFRYFDFKVTPGANYRYRIQLILYDPNHQVPEKFLDDKVTARRAKISQIKNETTRTTLLQARLGEWSELSPVVRVPFPGRVLAGEAEAPPRSGYNREPFVNAVLKKFDAVEGLSAATQLKLYPGSVGNATESVDAIDFRATYGGQLRPIEKCEFHTGTTVVDIRGGRSMWKKNNNDYTEPSELLLMDPTGRLFIETETDCREDLKEYKLIYDRPDKRGPESMDAENAAFGGESLMPSGGRGRRQGSRGR